MFCHSSERKYGPADYLVIHPGRGSAYLAVTYKPERAFRLAFLVYGGAHDFTSIRRWPANDEFLLLRRFYLCHMGVDSFPDIATHAYVSVSGIRTFLVIGYVAVISPERFESLSDLRSSKINKQVPDLAYAWDKPA